VTALVADEDQFLALVQSRAGIERSLKLEPTNRLLIWYDRTSA